MSSGRRPGTACSRTTRFSPVRPWPAASRRRRASPSAWRLGLPDRAALALLGAVAGTLVLTVVSMVAAAGVIVLRDGLTFRETVVVFDRAFRLDGRRRDRPRMAVRGRLDRRRVVGACRERRARAGAVARREARRIAIVTSSRACSVGRPSRSDGRGGGSSAARHRGFRLPVPRPRRVQGRQRRRAGSRCGRPGPGGGGAPPARVDPGHGRGGAPGRRRVHGAA